MMTLVYQKFLVAMFKKYWRLIYRKNPSKSARKQALSDVTYCIDEVLKEIRSLPLPIVPDRKALLVYAQHLFTQTPKIPRRKQLPSGAAIDILYNNRLRCAIECLSLMKYAPLEIEQILQNNDLLVPGKTETGVPEYLEWFFDLDGMPASDKDYYFTEAQKVKYYTTHCAIYWGTIDQQIVLARLGFSPEKISILDLLRNTMRMLLHQLQEDIIWGRLKESQIQAQNISYLSSAYTRMGGDGDGPEETLADYIRLVVPPPTKHLTPEDLYEHNRKLFGKRRANGERNNEQSIE